jgi:hypothetical protein
VRCRVIGKYGAVNYFREEKKAMKTKRGRIKTCLIAVAVCIALLGLVGMAEAGYYSTALAYDYDSESNLAYGQYFNTYAGYYGGAGYNVQSSMYDAFYYNYYAYLYAYYAYVEAYYGYEAIPITIGYYAYVYSYYNQYYLYYQYLYNYYAYEYNSPYYYIVTAAAYGLYADIYAAYAYYYTGLCSFGGWA